MWQDVSVAQGPCALLQHWHHDVSVAQGPCALRTNANITLSLTVGSYR